jgi:GntR family transcriptional regulator
MSEPRLVVDLDSGIAPWRQVRDQLVHLIGSGVLPTGTRLPAIRQLATDLGLAPGTVARAYRELEIDGLLHTARRRGTVVAGAPADPDPLRTLTEAYVARTPPLGADPNTAVAAVHRAYRSANRPADHGPEPTGSPGAGRPLHSVQA